MAFKNVRLARRNFVAHAKILCAMENFDNFCIRAEISARQPYIFEKLIKFEAGLKLLEM